jgi:hypothetical protein
MRRRIPGFDFDYFDRSFDFDFDDSFFDDGYATPWYIQKMIDSRNDVCVTINDFVPDYFEGVDVEDETNDFKMVDTDFVMLLLSPSYLREVGVDPSLWMDLKTFKEEVINSIILSRDIVDALNDNNFRKRSHRFINDLLSDLYRSEGIDKGKELVREILVFMGRGFPLEVVGLEDLSVYHSSYLFYVRVLNEISLVNVDDFRYVNGCETFYLKRIPSATGWDYIKFVESFTKYAISLFFESYSSEERDWGKKFQEGERILEILDRVVVKVKSVRVVNKKKEVWECDLDLLYKKTLREAVFSVLLSLPDGSREDFIDFIKDSLSGIDKIVSGNGKKFYPWRRIK